MASGTTWNLGEWALDLRPIREDDGPLWFELMQTMSWATRYKRGARRAEDLGPDDVRRAVAPDPEKEVVFVAVASRGREAKMVGVSRAARLRPDAWEFAIVVLDDWQKHGIGVTLMQLLMDSLEERRAAVIEGEVLASNKNMLDFLEHLGFEARPHPERAHIMRVTRKLVPGDGRRRQSAR